MGLGIALSELAWGVLTDKYGDRLILLIGLMSTSTLLWILCFFLTPSSDHIPSFLALLMACVLIGVLGGSVNGSSGKAVMQWFQDSERGFAMSIRQTAVPLGGILGALLLPPLAKNYGFISVFGILALNCSVTAVLTWKWLYAPPTANITTIIAAQPIHVAPQHPLKNSRLWLMALAIGLLCVPQFAILTFIAVFFHDFAHINLWITSFSLFMIQFAAMFFRIWSRYWTDKKKNRRAYLKTCSAICLISLVFLTYLCNVFSDSADLSITQHFILVLTVIVSGIIVSAWHGVAYTELADMAGVNKAATALGMGNTLAFLALFLTPLSIPFIINHSSWSMVWLLTSLCALLALLFFPKSHPS